jgi:DNA-binding response OmpR family regulator
MGGPSGTDRIPGSPSPPYRPVLIAEPNLQRAVALVERVQGFLVPCVIASEPLMFDYWRRSLAPSTFVLNLELEWSAVVVDELIREGVNVVGLSDSSEQRLWALDRGFSDVLPASISLEELAVKLWRFAEEEEEGISSGIEGDESLGNDGPLRVDLARRRMFWREHEIEVTPKLFDLVAYLAARPGVMVSIQTLLQDVWRERFAPPDKVHKSVSRLRTILGRDSIAFIVSRRGYYGYLPN